MGCDIHGTIEIKKYNDGGWWEVCKEIDIDRSYYLFSVLADVRNYREPIKPISKPRGTPDDVGYGHKELVEKWEGDGHSHSWVSFIELKNYKEPTDEFTFKEDYFYKFMEILAKDLGEDKVRLVFFFDN